LTHQRTGARVARRFADRIEMPDRDGCGAARVDGAHTRIDVRLHLAIEMELQFIVQLAIEMRRSEPAAQGDVETMVPAHPLISSVSRLSA
jgi:hypothetical protein